MRTRKCPRNTVCVSSFRNSSFKLKPALQGDVICLRVFSQVVVVLSSLSAIKDLLEKRGEIYSDRPPIPIVEMYILYWFISQSAAMVTIFVRTDLDWPLFMTGMTETWREGRKLVDHSLRPGAVMTYGQMMQEKTREFLTQLFATPKNFRDHVKLSVGRLPASSNIVWILTAGQPSGEIYHVIHLWLRPEGW